MKIKREDNIIVISGKDKGKQGRIIKVLTKEQRIIVENLNLRKKHQRPKTGGKKEKKLKCRDQFPFQPWRLFAKTAASQRELAAEFYLMARKLEFVKNVVWRPKNL